MIIKEDVIIGTHTRIVYLPKDASQHIPIITEELTKAVEDVTRYGATIVSHAWATNPRMPANALILTIITERPTE